MKVIIIGGGISGLTCAYELSKYNIYIELYEKDNEFGGLVQGIVKNGKYDEHSWRGFNKNYKNLFSIMKDINIYHNINFEKNITLHRESIPYYEYYKLFSFQLFQYIFYFFVYLFSSKDRIDKEYKNILLSSLIKYDKNNYFYNNLLGDLLHIGSDPFLVSAHTLYNLRFKCNTTWHHLKYPTNIAIINPWIKYLKSNDVQIFNNSKLENIKFTNNVNNAIDYLIINGEKKTADYYIFAIPPYALNKLFSKTLLSKKIENLHYTGQHKELSFRLYFKDKITISTNLSLPKSDWGIVLIPLHEFWDKNYKLGNNIKSIISGTCVTGGNISSNLNKNIFNSSKEEVINSIKYQLENNIYFNNIIKKYNNGKTLKDYTYDIKLWYKWYETDIGMDTDDIYWSNTYQTSTHRLNQYEGFYNLFFAGVHTKTSIDLATMESAAESGKLACLQLMKKANFKHNIFYHKHEYNPIIKMIKKADNVLFMNNLPNIFIIIILFILIKSIF